MRKFSVYAAKVSGNLMLVCAFILLIMAFLITSQGALLDTNGTLKVLGYPQIMFVFRWALAAYIVLVWFLSLQLKLR